MQISTRTKQNKTQSQTHLKSSSESTQITQEKSNLYLQQFIKQNKSIRNLNENFKEIPNPLISNIQSIFSSEERKKQVMTMVKKMREKQNPKFRKINENIGSIQLSNTNIFEIQSKRSMQKSSSVNKAYDDRYYNLNKEEYLYETKTNKSNINKYNKQYSNDNKSDLNDNLNVIYRNNNNDINNMKSSTYTRGKKRNGAEQNLFYSPNIFNTNNHTSNNKINYNNDNMIVSQDSQVSNTPVYQKKCLRGEKRHLTPNLNSGMSLSKNNNNDISIVSNYEIETFKLNIINKKKRKKITKDSFYFSIKTKKKKMKNSEYKIQTNDFNIINSKIKNKNKYNEEEDYYSGLKIIEFENGENILEIELEGSIKSINKKIKEEGILINDKEFKIYNDDMLEKEKENAVEEALKVQENLLTKTEEEFEEKEKEFEKIKNEEIKIALLKQEELFNNKIKELNIINEEKIKSALEEQKKIFENNNIYNKETNNNDLLIKEKENEIIILKEECKQKIETISLLEKTLEEREENFIKEKNNAIEKALKEQEINFNKMKNEEINNLINELKIKKEEEINNIKIEENNYNKEKENYFDELLEKQKIIFEKEKEELIKKVLNEQKEVLEKEYELKIKNILMEKEKENEIKLKELIENALKKQKEDFEDKIKEIELKKENEYKIILEEKEKEYLKDKEESIKKIKLEKEYENNKNKLNDNNLIFNSEKFSILKQQKEKPILYIEKKEKIELINNKLKYLNDKLKIENEENIEFTNKNNTNDVDVNNNLLFSFKKENQFKENKSLRYDDEEEDENNLNLENNEIAEFNLDKNKEEKKENLLKNEICLTNKSMQIPSGNIKKMIKILEEEKERLKLENKYNNNITENIIKEEEENEENEENNSNIKLKRAHTFIIPQVEGIIDKKPTINYKKKKPKNYNIFEKGNLLSESIEFKNEDFKDNLKKKAFELRMKLKSKKK